MFEKGRFFIKYHNIFYNQEWLQSLVQSIPESGWTRGKSRNGLYWPVHESYNLPNENIIQDLKENLNLNYITPESDKDEPFVFISRVDAGGLNLHYDHKRWGALLFPIIGNFEASPQIFATHDGTEIERFYFTKSKLHNNYTPIFFNSRAYHTVLYPSHETSSRYVLIVNVHSQPDEIYKNVENGNWFIKNTNNLGVRNA